ncbi:MAG: preprotein translocase subunit SecE [Bryocella sp.]
MSTEVNAAPVEDRNATHKTGQIERVGIFLKDVRTEMHKVVTPDRADVQSTTIIVIVVVFLFAAYFELVDLTLGRGIDQILLHLTKH